MSLDYLANHRELLDVLRDWMWNEWFADMGWSRRQVAALLAQRCERKLPLTLVALDDGRPVGLTQPSRA